LKHRVPDRASQIAIEVAVVDDVIEGEKDPDPTRLRSFVDIGRTVRQTVGAFERAIAESSPSAWVIGLKCFE
jgi:hypothetical protein